MEKICAKRMCLCGLFEHPQPAKWKHIPNDPKWARKTLLDQKLRQWNCSCIKYQSHMDRQVDLDRLRLTSLAVFPGELFEQLFWEQNTFPVYCYPRKNQDIINSVANELARVILSKRKGEYTIKENTKNAKSGLSACVLVGKHGYGVTLGW